MLRLETNSAWAVLTAANPCAFQNVGCGEVEVGLGTLVESPTFGWIYAPGSGDRGAHVSLFPNVSGNVVWARSSVPSAIVGTP